MTDNSTPPRNVQLIGPEELAELEWILDGATPNMDYAERAQVYGHFTEALRNAAPRLFAALRGAWAQNDRLLEFAQHNECAAIRTERDALRAENERLRWMLSEARSLLRIAEIDGRDSATRIMVERIDAALDQTKGEKP